MASTTTQRIDCPRSLALQEQAKQLIPGMTQLLSKRPDQFAPGVWPGYYQRAQGTDVWDMDGNRWLDMSIGGIGATILGYADPDVDATVRLSIENGVACSLNCPEEVELAQLMCELHPWAEQVRFARGGGEAMALAVRIARAATGRDVVAVCGYHGWHDWYLAANLGTTNALGEHLLPGLKPTGVPQGLAGTTRTFRYNHIDELRQIITDTKGRLAAVVMEPIRNDWPEPGFLESVRELASEVGAVFVFDEISSGFRMNTGGAHLLMNVEPDLATFAKAMGNGYAISAVIGRSSVMQAVQDSFISSTNWTERVGPTAALATLRKHRDCKVGPHLMDIGQRIQEGWKRCAQRQGLEIHVGGIPPLSHFSFSGPDAQRMKSLFVERMMRHGILASTSFYPMYAHTPEHVHRYLAAADEAFRDVADITRRGALEQEAPHRPLPASSV